MSAQIGGGNMEDKENKTEEATAKRLKDARKKGQVAKGEDLTSAVSFVVFGGLIGVLGPFIYNNSLSFMNNSMRINHNLDLTSRNAGIMLINNVMQFGFLLLPFAFIAVTIGIVVNLIQVGFLFTTHPLKPDFKRLNPIEGFKNIVSKKAMFKLVKNILKLIVVFYMTYRNLSKSLVKIPNAGSIGTQKLFPYMLDFVKGLSMDIAILMFILAVIDYVFQRRSFKKDQRMSKQEIKDEFKEMEGNMQLKQARQQRHRQLAMSQMMGNIPDSTVVITNPTHLAVVLRYDTTVDKAPIVTAKGADYIAKKIREIAKENKIPIMENKELARAMYKQVEIGEQVPVELYKAIAEILAIVYQMKEKNKRKI